MLTTYSFADAGRRLVKGAFTLWEREAYETAGHLAGLSAECVLKSIMEHLGILQVDAFGTPTNAKQKVHITALWSEFHAHLDGRAGLAILAVIPPRDARPFDGWDIAHRYVAEKQLDVRDVERWMWSDPQTANPFNFDISDPDAPHSPIPVFWGREFQDWDPTAENATVTPSQVQAAFGGLLEYFDELVVEKIPLS